MSINMILCMHLSQIYYKIFRTLKITINFGCISLIICAILTTPTNLPPFIASAARLQAWHAQFNCSSTIFIQLLNKFHLLVSLFGHQTLDTRTDAPQCGSSYSRRSTRCRHSTRAPRSQRRWQKAKRPTFHRL